MVASRSGSPEAVTGAPASERHVPRAATGRLATTACTAAVWAYLLGTFVPWRPTGSWSLLDGSWLLALHRAFLNRVDFGHRFVFTFGPWGFLYSGSHPRTYSLAVVVWSILAGLYATGVCRLARRLPSWYARAPWLLAACVLPGVDQWPDVRLLAVTWLLPLVHFYGDEGDDRRDAPFKGLLAAALGLIALTKFSLAIVAVAAVGAVSLDQLGRRRAPWLAAVFVGSMAVFWSAAGQPPSSAWPYLRHALVISDGYDQGVALYQDTENTDLLGIVIVPVVLVGAVVAQTHRRRIAHAGPSAAGGAAARGAGAERWRAAVAGGAVAVILVVVTKAGFIRHDEHELITAYCVPLMVLLYVPVTWRWVGFRERAALVLAFVIGLMQVERLDRRVSGNSAVGRMGGTLTALPGRVAVAGRWVAGRAAPDVGTRRAFDAVADVVAALGVGQDTVDLFGNEVGALIAGHWNYRPRPVPQVYLAFAPELSRLNADFLDGPDAPRDVILHLVPIDFHYPSLEDSLAWLPLLSRYDPVDRPAGVPGQFVLLRRSPSPRRVRLVPVGHATGSLGQWLAVPPVDGPIWARVAVRLTAEGKLLHAAFKVPGLGMLVRTRDGQVHASTLVRENAAGGFLLSPMVSDANALAALARDANSPSLRPFDVRAVRVWPNTIWPVPGAYDPVITATFYRVDLR